MSPLLELFSDRISLISDLVWREFTILVEGGCGPRGGLLCCAVCVSVFIFDSMLLSAVE